MNDESGKSNTKHSYKVFGLHIESDILLPELLNVNKPPVAPDVRISIGKVPANIVDPIEKTQVYQAAKDQFLFRVPGAGCYYVTGGNRIVVEPAEQAKEITVRLFLLGTTFGALLMQRGILPIHGSAVVINGCCVIFTGASGAGKSTMLAAFRKRGYLFLTDDVAAVTLDADGIAWVQASYPQQKLWRDSAETIGVDTSSLTPFFTGNDKDKFAIPAHKGFWRSSMPLVAVYELEVEKRQDVTISSLAGMDKLAVLISHTYRPWLVDGLDLKEAHFQQCVTVARQVAVSRLARPEGMFSLEEQVRLVQQDLARQRACRAV